MGEPALEHLRIRLAGVHRALRAAVRRQARIAARLTRPDLTPYCVTDEQVEVLLGEVCAFTDAMTGPLPPRRPEPEVERELRRRASAEGETLPLDALATRFGLSRAEQDALLLAVAPELDRGYERIYAYVVDNLNRRLPNVELLVTVVALGGADPDGTGTAAEWSDVAARVLPATYSFFTPALFLGAGALLLAAALPFHRGVARRERLVWGGLVAGVLLSAQWEPTHLVWHVFATPNGSPYRQTFVLAGVVVMAAWTGVAAGWPGRRALLGG
ncbi:YfhO family protein, partial [Streptomyces sp. Act-28]